MRQPYHVVNRLNLLMLSASVIKLLSNPRIPINALACSSGINRNSRVANQLNNLALGINYYLLYIISFWKNERIGLQKSDRNKGIGLTMHADHYYY